MSNHMHHCHATISGQTVRTQLKNDDTQLETGENMGYCPSVILGGTLRKLAKGLSYCNTNGNI